MPEAWATLVESHTAFCYWPSHTVWTVDFETPVCKLYLLFITADAEKKKGKREVSAAAHWCFKVCSPYSIISCV
jgi:hypothetical protein